jgi:hypothetical protein
MTQRAVSILRSAARRPSLVSSIYAAMVGEVGGCAGDCADHLEHEPNFLANPVGASTGRVFAEASATRAVAYRAGLCVN